MEIGAANREELISGQDAVAVVARVSGHTDADLAQVTQTICLLCLVFRPGEGGQKHRREDCDDRNHDEEFNQSETRISA